MKLQLTNTLTKKKEVFEPLEEGKVKLYGCGVTPYDYSHIGHGRSYVFVDLLTRFLQFIGYDVSYVRNVTDIDDKLINKAEKAGDIMGYKALAEKFTELYRGEMDRLNCLPPKVEPLVTEHIKEIVEFIEGLIAAGKAYVVDNDVYFDVESFGEEYGKLSGKKLEDLQAGARVAVDERKKNPADFALWKGNDKELFWESPWGHGRPGWHIECSALAKAYLGESLDIHCGGMDLVFPHHENERAQSEALHGKIFTRYWVHNALLNIDKQKMSKSLGNILSLKEIFEKYDPMVLRYYFLQHHYRTPIDFSFELLKSAQVAYKKLIHCFEGTEGDSTAEELLPAVQEMVNALSDDLNSPKALGIVFEHLQEVRENKTLRIQVKSFLQGVLGLTLTPLQEEVVELTPEIRALIKEREEARGEKNWAKADEIRDQLKALGYEVQDKKLPY